MSRHPNRAPTPLPPLAPPRLAASGYEVAGYWILSACVRRSVDTDPVARVAYNQAVGSLWVMCSSSRMVPTSEKFERALATARHTLDAAYAASETSTARREWERASAALNRAEQEAVEAGILK